MTRQPEPHPQLIRVYMRPGHDPWDPREYYRVRSRQDSIESDLGHTIWRIGAPWEHWVLVFDVETTTETDQLPRVGCWLVGGIDPGERMMLARSGQLTREILDSIFDLGFFYDPRRVSGQEVETIRRFAGSEETRRWLKEIGLVYPAEMLCVVEDTVMQSMSELEMFKFLLAGGSPAGPPARVLLKETFVCDVLYRWGYEDGALVVGHNLPFDLAALAEDWKPGRWEDGNGTPYRAADPKRPGEWIDYGQPQAEGFTLHLCSCPDREDGSCFTHPPIRIRHIARGINFMRFQHRAVPAKDGEDRYSDSFDGRFLDTLTLGRALRGGSGSASLESLSAAFGVPYEKRKVDLAGPVDERLLTYLLEDVLATWHLYQRERDDYRRFGLS